MSGRREDDLRAAFAAKATEAPAASDVARAVNGKISRGPKRRPWLVPAVVTAAAAAVVVPLAFALANGGTDSKKSNGDAALPNKSVQASSGARGGAGAPGGAAGAKPSGPPAPANGKIAPGSCRPTDVTATLRRTATGATLTVTSHGVACRLDRMPSVQWPGSGTTYSSSATAERSGSKSPSGRLAGGATATATVRSAAPCALSGDVVRVDWGAGPIEVRVEGTPAAPSCASADSEALEVGGFTGLS